MTPAHSDQLAQVRRLFLEMRFVEAADAAERVLRSAASISTEELVDATRYLVGHSDLFPVERRMFGHAELPAVYERVVAVLVELLGAEHAAVAAARGQLAMTYAFEGKPARAAEEFERSLATIKRQLGPDDPNLTLVRDNLAVQYRATGRTADAERLYAEMDVCEHLQPAKRAIQEAGGKITYVGTPWSRNCRRWMYFSGVVIDGELLRARLGLSPVVAVHAHRGTHDGHEQGLVCNEHHDAVMGPHASMADATLKVVG